MGPIDLTTSYSLLRKSWVLLGKANGEDLKQFLFLLGFPATTHNLSRLLSCLALNESLEVLLGDLDEHLDIDEGLDHAIMNLKTLKWRRGKIYAVDILEVLGLTINEKTLNLASQMVEANFANKISLSLLCQQNRKVC